jgi:hypothetical protein
LAEIVDNGFVMLSLSAQVAYLDTSGKQPGRNIDRDARFCVSTRAGILAPPAHAVTTEAPSRGGHSRMIFLLLLLFTDTSSDLTT